MMMFIKKLFYILREELSNNNVSKWIYMFYIIYLFTFNLVCCATEETISKLWVGCHVTLDTPLRFKYDWWNSKHPSEAEI